ncbi:hypothetical protein CR513_11269, partial [Mucuna pruriens]
MEQAINASRSIQSYRCTTLVVKNQKIFQDMVCINTQKVTIVTFMNGVPKAQVGQQDSGRLCNQVEEYRDTFFIIRIKFVNGLQPKIQQAINYQEICQCPSLVNKCRILDKENRAKVMHYKGVDPIKDNKDNKFTNQAKKFLREDAQVYITLVCLKVKKEVVVVDVCNIPSKSRVPLSIDLTIATTPYTMSPLELVEPKRQLEKLLEK